MSNPIEVIGVSVKVGLPKKLLQVYRENPEYNLTNLTDEELVSALVDDILERYFNTEYFDLSGIE